MVRLYPGYIVPPVPKKPLKKLETDFMEKRRGKLQLFLNNLLKHPVLRGSDAVWQFLTMESEKDYEKFKKDVDKVPRPKEPIEATTLEGKATISFDKLLEESCTETHVGLRDISKEFKE